MNIEAEILGRLAAMPRPVPTKEQEENTQEAVRMADWASDYKAWIDAGAEEEAEAEDEVLAVAGLPDRPFRLSLEIVARRDRPRFVAAVEPMLIRELVVWYQFLLDRLADGDDETDPRNPALRPRPRRKGRGFGYT